MADQTDDNLAPDDRPAMDVVDVHLNCVGCGYDLTSLSVDGRCPECGLAICDTLTYGLSHHAAKDLQKLYDASRTISVMTWVAIPSLVIAPLGAACITGAGILISGLGLWAGGSAVAAFPVRGDDPIARSIARSMRWLPLGPILAIVLSAVAIILEWRYRAIVPFCWLGFLCIPLWLAAFHMFVSRIARDGSDSDIELAALSTSAIIVVTSGMSLIMLVSDCMTDSANVISAAATMLLVGLALALIPHIIAMSRLIRLVRKSLTIRKTLDQSHKTATLTSVDNPGASPAGDGRDD